MKKPLYAAIILVILSLGIHLYLTSLHYNLRQGAHQGEAVCDINSSFSCSSVAMSSFSKIGPIPISLIGASLHLVLLFLLLIPSIGLTSNEYALYRLGYLLAGLSVAASIIMGGISLMLMNTYCLFCIGLYVLSFLIFYFIYQLQNNDQTPTENPMEFRIGFFGPFTPISLTGTLMTVPLITLLLHVSFGGLLTLEGLSQIEKGYIATWKASNDYDISGPQGLSKGAPIEQAKMVIYEFADYLCSHCKQAAPVMRTFVELNKSDVHLTLYSFPLDGGCNPGIPKAYDGKRCRLAKAVFCAEKQKLGWSMHDHIFANQSLFFEMGGLGDIDEDTKNFMKANLSNTDNFSECLDSEEAQDAILAQAKLGERVNVSGTPAIFVNNRRLRGGQSPEVLEAVLKELKNGY